MLSGWSVQSKDGISNWWVFFFFNICNQQLTSNIYWLVMFMTDMTNMVQWTIFLTNFNLVLQLTQLLHLFLFSFSCTHGFIKQAMLMWRVFLVRHWALVTALYIISAALIFPLKNEKQKEVNCPVELLRCCNVLFSHEQRCTKSKGIVPRAVLVEDTDLRHPSGKKGSCMTWALGVEE